MTSIQKANAPPRGTADMLVVKDNALINASYNLELVEQRLILLAIIEARETGKGINANDALTIHASSYIQNFNVQKAYSLWCVERCLPRPIFKAI